MGAVNFRLPYEHGAWWTFFTCLLAGLLQALVHGAYPLTALSLALSMACLFFASDWLTGVMQLLVQGRLGGHSHWRSLKGWALFGISAALGLGALALADSGPKTWLTEILMVCILASAGVLFLRIKLLPRDLRLMMVSAGLLTLPVLVLGSLAFGGLKARAFEYWGLWGWYFVWGVAYVQTWMRGNSLPKWRQRAASLPFLALALALVLLKRWPDALVLLLLSARVAWRIHVRLRDDPGPGASPRLPTDPAQVRRLGYEQVAASLLLTMIWIWTFRSL